LDDQGVALATNDFDFGAFGERSPIVANAKPVGGLVADSASTGGADGLFDIAFALPGSTEIVLVEGLDGLETLAIQHFEFLLWTGTMIGRGAVRPLGLSELHGFIWCQGVMALPLCKEPVA
jgi:hypothetical protein